MKRAQTTPAVPTTFHAKAAAAALPLAALAALSLGAAPAEAQTVCGKRADIVRQLGERYGETRRSAGFAEGQGVVEVYASDTTGSWTILLTSPQGMACLLAAGEGFEAEPAQPAGNPA